MKKCKLFNDVEANIGIFIVSLSGVFASIHSIYNAVSIYADPFSLEIHRDFTIIFLIGIVIGSIIPLMVINLVKNVVLKLMRSIYKQNRQLHLVVNLILMFILEILMKHLIQIQILDV